MIDFSKLLDKTVFIAHPEEELNMDEEASVYSSAEEAAEDLCANYVTEIILLKTTSIEKLKSKRSTTAEEKDGG